MIEREAYGSRLVPPKNIFSHIFFFEISRKYLEISRKYLEISRKHLEICNIHDLLNPLSRECSWVLTQGSSSGGPELGFEIFVRRF